MTEKTIWYFHGLESKPGGQKEAFLREQGDVYAPWVDYRNYGSGQFEELLERAERKGIPDLVIGSSMGGYLAAMLASHLDCPAFLVNPALHSRSIDLSLPEGEHTPYTVVMLGMDDEVIPASRSLELLGDHHHVVKLEGVGHRVNIENFAEVYLDFFGSTFERLEGDDDDDDDGDDDDDDADADDDVETLP